MSKPVVFIPSAEFEFKYKVVDYFQSSFVEEFNFLGYDTEFFSGKNPQPGSFFFYFGSYSALERLTDFQNIPIVNYIIDHPNHYYPGDAPVNHLPVVIEPHYLDFMRFLKKIGVHPAGNATLSPHAGYISPNPKPPITEPASKREISVLFSGSVQDPETLRKKWHNELPEYAHELDYIAQTALQLQKDTALDQWIGYDKIIAHINSTQTRDLLWFADNYHRNYRRLECLRTLAQAGIRVTAYVDEPELLNALLPEKHRFIIREQVDFIKMLELMRNSKIVLTPAYSNGVGLFSERIPSAMRNGAVSVSAGSHHLLQYFRPEEDALFYAQHEIAAVPDMINGLLNDPKRLDRIAESGRAKAEAGHTPRHRAQDIVKAVKAFIARS